MTLDDLKMTVARTSGANLPAGTAFLVSETHALTCAHCVLDDADNVAGAVTMYFGLWDGDRQRGATVEAVDRDRDVALLRLSAPAIAPPCPRAANAINGVLWQAFGYPKQQGQNGIAIGGDVVDVNARTGQRVERRVIQLRCHEAGDELHGASGSPVFVNGTIVGMITNQPKGWSKPDRDGNREAEPIFGALFALSIGQIAASPGMPEAIEWVNREVAPVERRESSEADLLRQYRQIIESVPKLSSIKVPRRGGTLETVPLERIYVEPDVHGLQTLDEIWRRRRVALTGEEGLGKRAFLNYLNLHLLRAGGSADDGNGDGHVWPLSVELDRFARQTDRLDLVDFALDDLFGRDQHEQLRTHLKTCSREGRVVLLGDGLEHAGDQYERVIDALSRQPRFVVAVRPGRRTDIGQEVGGTLRLQPFDRRRIKEFVRRWIDAMDQRTRDFNEERVLQELSNQPSLLALAGIPRFLGLICCALSGGHRVVATRTALIFGVWDSVWDAAFGQTNFARRRAASKALQQLAREIFERASSINREFSEEDLYEALERAGEREADAVVAGLIEHEIIGLGRDSAYATRSFRFSFEGIQQYLAAEALANDAAFLKALPTLALDNRWSQILPIVAGILARRANGTGAVRDFITALAGLGNGESFGLHVCLVAECLAEVPPDVRAQLQPLSDEMAHRMLSVLLDQPAAIARMVVSIRRLQPPMLRSGLQAVVADSAQPLQHRAVAAYALGAFSDDEALHALVLLASGAELAAVRSAACLGLARLGRDDAADALVTALDDPDRTVRITAARCLAQRRDRTRTADVLSGWLDYLKRERGSDFLEAVESIGWAVAIVLLQPESTVAPLLASLVGGSDAAKQFAVQVLAETRTRAAAWPGIRVVDTDANDGVRQAVAQMLIRVGTEASINALRTAIERGDQAVKLGALIGFSTDQAARSGPAGDLLQDPADSTLTWPMMVAAEAEVFEQQAADNRQALDARVAEVGRDAVLAEARRHFSQAAGPESQNPSDLLSQFAGMFSPDADWERATAFETIQLLDPDPDLMVDALFDRNLNVAVRAAAWIGVRRRDLPIERLLDRVQATPLDPNSLSYSAAVNALGRLEHLGPLIEHYRQGSRMPAQALWLLCFQYGIRVYDDGRVELPDGQIEKNYQVVQDRLRQLNAAAAREPGDATVDRTLALEAAKAEFAAAWQWMPADAAGWVSRAAIHVMLGEPQQALESIAAAIALDDKTPLWFRFAEVVIVAADAAQASRFLEPAPEQFWDLYLTIARRQLAEGALDSAFTNAKRVIIASPLHPAARVLRARVWVEQGHPEFAIGDLSDLASRLQDADSGELLAALEELQVVRGFALSRALTEKQLADALGVRGALRLVLDDTDGARADLELAVARGAGDYNMLNSLAWIYGDQGVNLEEASRLAERALKALDTAVLAGGADKAMVLDTLGWVSFKRGQRDEAQRALEQAAALLPDNAEIGRHLETVKAAV